MASLIDEHTQFTDSAGTPIVNGYLYVGTQNLDPVANPVNIFSDRELTVALSNPQRTDSDGRSVNKIWIGVSKYSLKVEDLNNVQQYLELDNGEIQQTGISVLTNVQGTNTITATGDPTITTLADAQQYNFRAANANTGAVTLQIDLTPAKTIKKLHDIDLATGDIEQNQTVAVIYNSTDDVFELVTNPSNTSVGVLNISSDILMDEAADHTSTPIAGKGIWWTRNDVPNIPMFTDDAGTDFELNITTSGTWAPAWGSSGTPTTPTVEGYYAKIGNLVYITCYLDFLNKNTLTAGIEITGLPFNGKDFTNNAAVSMLSVEFTQGLSVASGEVPMANIPGNGNKIVLNHATAGAATSLLYSDIPGATAASISVSGFYLTN